VETTQLVAKLALAEAVLDAVKDSGLLRKRPGRKRRQSRADKAKALVAPRKRRRSGRPVDYATDDGDQRVDDEG